MRQKLIGFEHGCAYHTAISYTPWEHTTHHFLVHEGFKGSLSLLFFFLFLAQTLLHVMEQSIGHVMSRSD